MPTLIDGHNLIPKMGLRLDALEDEAELVARLNEFCRLSRKRQVEVYFDNAPVGQPESRRIGLVTAHFVRRPLIADEAIRLRLKKLGRSAKNWMVVSSDREVQRAASASGARVQSSEEFAQTILDMLRAGPPSKEKRSSMTPHELEEWIHLFTRGKE